MLVPDNQGPIYWVKLGQRGWVVTTETEISMGNDAADASRREFLKKAAIVAWSAPVIMTVTANRASASHLGPAPCAHTGAACTATLTTPLRTCCATAASPSTSQLVCCPTGTANAGKCGVASGNSNLGLNNCGSRADCCSGDCSPSGRCRN